MLQRTVPQYQAGLECLHGPDSRFGPDMRTAHVPSFRCAFTQGSRRTHERHRYENSCGKSYFCFGTWTLQRLFPGHGYDGSHGAFPLPGRSALSYCNACSRRKNGRVRQQGGSPASEPQLRTGLWRRRRYPWPCYRKPGTPTVSPGGIFHVPKQLP